MNKVYTSWSDVCREWKLYLVVILIGWAFKVAPDDSLVKLKIASIFENWDGD